MWIIINGHFLRCFSGKSNQEISMWKLQTFRSLFKPQIHYQLKMACIDQIKILHMYLTFTNTLKYVTAKERTTGGTGHYVPPAK